jgi:hypothetical protein
MNPLLLALALFSSPAEAKDRMDIKMEMGFELVYTAVSENLYKLSRSAGDAKGHIKAKKGWFSRVNREIPETRVEISAEEIAGELEFLEGNRVRLYFRNKDGKENNFVFAATFDDQGGFRITEKEAQRVQADSIRAANTKLRKLMAKDDMKIVKNSTLSSDLLCQKVPDEGTIACAMKSSIDFLAEEVD